MRELKRLGDVDAEPNWFVTSMRIFDDNEHCVGASAEDLGASALGAAEEHCVDASAEEDSAGLRRFFGFRRFLGPGMPSRQLRRQLSAKRQCPRRWAPPREG